MNIRTFLRGGYREITGPTTVISGTTRLFIVTPAEATPRSAHPEPEGATGPAPTGGATPATAGGQAEAPPPPVPHSPRGGRGRRPAGASIQQTLDRAAKEARK